MTPSDNAVSKSIIVPKAPLKQDDKVHNVNLGDINNVVDANVYQSLEYRGVCSNNIFGNKGRQVFDEMTDS